MLREASRLGLGLLAVWALASCGDPEKGGITGIFEYDDTITAMSLDGIGVDLGGDALPDSGTDYALEPAETTILWTASGTTYSLDVTIEPDTGVESEDPSLIPFSFGKPSEDGEDVLLFFEFAGDEVTISRRLALYTGVEVP